MLASCLRCALLFGNDISRLLYARSKCVRFSPSGAVFAIASTDGLMLFSQDATLSFVPFDLTEDVTPEAARAALAVHQYSTALVVRNSCACSFVGCSLLLLMCVLSCAAFAQMALHLNLTDLITEVLVNVPRASVDAVARAIPQPFLQRFVIWTVF